MGIYEMGAGGRKSHDTSTRARQAIRWWQHHREAGHEGFRRWLMVRYEESGDEAAQNKTADTYSNRPTPLHLLGASRNLHSSPARLRQKLL